MSMQKVVENHRLQADGGGSVFGKFIGLQPMRGVHIFENKTMKIYVFKYQRLLPMVSAKTNALTWGEVEESSIRVVYGIYTVYTVYTRLYAVYEV
jgi:hypothetical protein